MSAAAGAMQEEAPLGKAYDARLARRLMPYLLPQWRRIAVSFAVLAGVSGAQLVQPWLIKHAIDDHIAARRLDGLAPLAALFLAALTAELVLRFGQLYLLQQAAQNVITAIRVQVFAHLMRLPSRFFDRNPVGRLVTRVTTDVEALEEMLTSGAVLMLADLVKLAAIVVILVGMNARLSGVTLAIVPVMALVSVWVRRRMRAAYRAIRAEVSRLNAFLQEQVSGMRIVQLFAREPQSAAEFRQRNAAHRDAELSGVRFESLFSAVVELIGSVALAAILWVGGRQCLEGALTFGTLVAFIEYANRFFQPVQELSQRYAVMQAAMASAERIVAVLDTPPAVERGVGRRLVTRPRGAIVFDRVTFGYDPERPVLHDVSFSVAPGERIAVVGWTGSGKSTLIRLLTRLYAIDSGRILLDGEDVAQLDVHDLRRAIGVVLQDHYLFAGSVASNISLGDPAIDLVKIQAAARAVHADGFIAALPGGYDEPVRERGNNFSMGERQLLSFARAVAFNPAILVLDEATASVDPRTEQRIQEALETVLAGRTSITIAHRLVTVRRADRILVLHHGVLREQGSHAELMELEGGIYRALYRLQHAET